MARFLDERHAELGAIDEGAVATYIPQLACADPRLFGICLATTDGHVYCSGDSDAPFTIQSVSKPFVFALALEMLGPDAVHDVIGVEPSGEAFNSIRLLPDNRPFNPMVNAGAIACTGLIYRAAGAAGFERIHAMLSRFAGRALAVDEAVFESERETGDRNRAIAYLLRNHGILHGEVDATVEGYFRQCAVLVTARDLAVMGATLANRGINPLTGEKVISGGTVARTLSVMTTSGMYDYAGQWTYRVGIPAKSGVGGGIVASLPAQFGLGTYSPLLDGYGNSVRGVKLCETLSRSFGLHLLRRGGDVRSVIFADYPLRGIASRRNRQPQERRILDACGETIHILELAGPLDFAAADRIARRVRALLPGLEILLIDFSHVPSDTEAAGALMAALLRSLGEVGVRAVLSHLDRAEALIAAIAAMPPGPARPVVLALFEQAIEWAEDQAIFSRDGFAHLRRKTELTDQPLLQGLSIDEVALLAVQGTERQVAPGTRLIAAGEPAGSVFFLLSGMVSVKLPNGVGLSTLAQGTSVGEIALLGGERTADVWTDTAVTCLELPTAAFAALRADRPALSERIMRNLAEMMVQRLREANARIAFRTSR